MDCRDRSLARLVISVRFLLLSSRAFLRTHTLTTSFSTEQISNYCINARRRDIKNMRHEAGLSPQMAPEPSPNGEVLNHRKRRSSDESSKEDQLMDSEPDKRRRRH